MPSNRPSADQEQQYTKSQGRHVKRRLDDTGGDRMEEGRVGGRNNSYEQIIGEQVGRTAAFIERFVCFFFLSFYTFFPFSLLIKKRGRNFCFSFSSLLIFLVYFSKIACNRYVCPFPIKHR